MPQPAITIISESEKIELKVQQTIFLSANVENAEGIITWSSSSSDIATIDSNGKLVGIGLGTCTIFAMLPDYGISDSIEVEVIPNPDLYHIELNYPSANIKVGDTLCLKPIFKETGEEYVGEGKWSSDSPDIADVDQGGMVTALAIGEATISFVSANGRTAECYLSIEKNYIPEPYPEEKPYSPIEDTGELGSGIVSPSTNEETADMAYSLEKYALDNLTGGIPLYEKAEYLKYSSRLILPQKEGFEDSLSRIYHGSLNEKTDMYDGPINESVEEWEPYFHDYATIDSGTFNAWDSQGSDVSNRMSMISSSYFSTKPSNDGKKYARVGSLSITDEPIMLEANGQEAPDEYKDVASQFWRVKVHTGAGYTYHMAPTASAALREKYDGREVQLEDYLTPFKAMLNALLFRWTDLVSDTSGFQGAMEYAYDTQAQQGAWKDSGVGIQINEAENSIDFTFIKPQTLDEARKILSSKIFSPVPAEFLEDIGGGSFNAGAKNFGTRSSFSPTGCFDNILVLGAYVPTYWEEYQKIVYEAVDDYYEADQHHYDGYVVSIYANEQEAYEAFLNNGLDVVRIPLNNLSTHKDDRYVLKEETGVPVMLNLNACTEENWEKLFGMNGTIYPHSVNDYWDVKPIMGYRDFINGLYYCIDRQEIAALAGGTPQVGYVGNSAMFPDGSIYRESKWGQSAVWDRQNEAKDGFCYNPDVAMGYFEQVGKGLVGSGVYSAGDVIKLNILSISNELSKVIGEYLKNDIEDAFNDANESIGLKIEISFVTSNSRNDAYTQYDHGEFDIGLLDSEYHGDDIITTLSRLSTTNSLSNGFGLSFVSPTSEINKANPCVYDGKRYSYDAICEALRSVSLVKDGAASPIIGDVRLLDGVNDISVIMEILNYALDGNNNPELRYSISSPAIMIGTTQNPTSGYYVEDPTKLYVGEDGLLYLSFSKSSLQKYIDSFVQYEGSAKYFSLYFAVFCEIKANFGKITKATYVNAPGLIEEFGLTVNNI